MSSSVCLEKFDSRVPSVAVVASAGVCEERGAGETPGIPTLTNNYHNILWSADITLMSIFITLET